MESPRVAALQSILTAMKSIPAATNREGLGKFTLLHLRNAVALSLVSGMTGDTTNCAMRGQSDLVAWTVLTLKQGEPSMISEDNSLFA